MRGFEAPKGGNKKKNTPENYPQKTLGAHFTKAINLHIKGDIANAEKAYRAGYGRVIGIPENGGIALEGSRRLRRGLG